MSFQLDVKLPTHPLSVTRKEDDYCSLIFQSDVCLFLFSKNLGKYSLEEYEYSEEIVKRNHKIHFTPFIRRYTAIKEFINTIKAPNRIFIKANLSS